MGEWKLILGSYEKEVKGFQGKESRQATVYQILTRDSRTFIIYDYEIIEEDKITEKLSNVLEIDGVFYKRHGSEEKYPTNFNDAVDCYIKNWKMSMPSYDIKDVKTAIKFFKELDDLKSELLMLNA
jgi:hypothetical protein